MEQDERVATRTHLQPLLCPITVMDDTRVGQRIIHEEATLGPRDLSIEERFELLLICGK